MAGLEAVATIFEGASCPAFSGSFCLAVLVVCAVTFLALGALLAEAAAPAVSTFFFLLLASKE